MQLPKAVRCIESDGDREQIDLSGAEAVKNHAALQPTQALWSSQYPLQCFLERVPKAGEANAHFHTSPHPVVSAEAGFPRLGHERPGVWQRKSIAGLTTIRAARG